MEDELAEEVEKEAEVEKDKGTGQTRLPPAESLAGCCQGATEVKEVEEHATEDDARFIENLRVFVDLRAVNLGACREDELSAVLGRAFVAAVMGA